METPQAESARRLPAFQSDHFTPYSLGIVRGPEALLSFAVITEVTGAGEFVAQMAKKVLAAAIQKLRSRFTRARVNCAELLQP
jgi:hypothetical protein